LKNRLLLTKVERISGRRGNDNDSSENPLQEIWTEWSIERLRGCPEPGVGENTLPIDLNQPTLEKIPKFTDLPHSRMTREEPITTASKFPKLLIATRELRAVTERFEPNTAVKNRLAVSSLDVRMDSFGTCEGVVLVFRFVGAPP